MRPTVWSAVCALLIALACVNATPRVLLVDSSSGAYLRNELAPGRISKPAMQGLLSGLTGLLPGHALDASTSEQIGSFLRPSPFKKPRAHMSLDVAGLSQDDLQSIFSGRQQVALDLDAGEGESMVDLMPDMFRDLVSANPEVPLALLDQAIKKQQQEDLLRSILGTQQTRAGFLALSDDTYLDSTLKPDGFFQTELACFCNGLQAQLQPPVSRSPVQDIQLLQMSMLGLQGLINQYGSETKAVSASREATKQVMQWAVSRLNEAYDGDFTVQINMLDPAPTGTLEDVLAIKESVRSRLLLASSTTVEVPTTAADWLVGDETAMAKRFSAKAAAYGGFILLLYFLLAGVYSLCFMPFKRDTLLFGATKGQ